MKEQRSYGVLRKATAPLLVAAIAFAIVTAGTSIADTTSSPITVGDSGDETHGAQLVINGNSGDNEVTVGYSSIGNQYVVDSPDGIVTTTCTTISTTEVQCFRVGGPEGIGLHGGDDYLDLKTKEVSGNSYGDEGDDVMLGSGYANLLDGGKGADVIEGARGNDHIYGGLGPDVLRGQRGNDTIHAQDDRRDTVINCGPGSHDVAYIDRKLDPMPIGCERVSYKPAPLRN